jgi:hypothetical protein
MKDLRQHGINVKLHNGGYRMVGAGKMPKNKSISLYVAAKFNRKDEVKKLHKEAKKRGWTISEDWTRHEKVDIMEVGTIIAEMRAQDDLEGVTIADVFIMLADEPGPGMYVELGVAIAMSVTYGTPLIILVVPEELKCRSIFFYHPNVIRRTTTEGLLEEAERFIKGELPC